MLTISNEELQQQLLQNNSLIREYYNRDVLVLMKDVFDYPEGKIDVLKLFQGIYMTSKEGIGFYSIQHLHMYPLHRLGDAVKRFTAVDYFRSMDEPNCR